MNNFEENIKDKLNRRTILPSQESWSKLSGKLEKKEKKSTRKFWLMGVAASFLIGVFLTSLLFKAAKIDIEKQQVVEETKLIEKEKIVPVSSEIIQEQELMPLVKNNDLVEVTDSPKALKSTEQKSIKTSAKKDQSTATVASETPTTTKTEITEKEQQLFIVQEIDKKAQQVVDQVKELSENREVTDAEIDELIRKAQLEIRTRSIFEEQKNKVNAQALLQDVEADLDQSFRERIFIAIENGFSQVKSAVSFMN